MLSELPFQSLIPDVIAEDELPQALLQSLLAFGVQKVPLSPEGVEYVSELSEIYPRPSRADLFALACAGETDCVLLSGDKALRSAALEEGVVVHGTLWLLDECVRLGVLSNIEAGESLKRMIAAKSRFPEGEVRKRLSKWRKKAE